MPDTPGPWINNFGLIETESDSIAEISNYMLGGESESDAKLIAAAPDLLEALREIVELTIGGNDVIRSIAYEAIRKATE